MIDFEDRTTLLRRLLAEPEETIATNVLRTRYIRDSCRVLDFEDIRLQLTAESDALVRTCRREVT